MAGLEMWWVAILVATIPILVRSILWSLGGCNRKQIVAPATTYTFEVGSRSHQWDREPSPGIPFTREGMDLLELHWVMNDHLDLTLEEFTTQRYHWCYCAICKTEYLLENDRDTVRCGTCGAGTFSPNQLDAREKAQAWLRSVGTSLEECQDNWAKKPAIKSLSELERIPRDQEHEKDRIILAQQQDIARLRLLLREARQAVRASQEEEIQEQPRRQVRGSVRQHPHRGPGLPECG